MTALTGFLFTAAPVWTQDHLHQVALDELGDALYAERQASEPATGADGALTPTAASALPLLTLQGVVGGSYADDWYNRIHVIPAEIALGNVVSAQVQTITIWNAFFEPRTLTAIDGSADGMTVAGQPAPPLDFTALQQREWQVTVTLDGPPILDSKVTWSFSDGSAPAVRITANRVIAWPWVPDWTDGIVERLAWATDVSTSESGAEQRRALRISPRREFDASFILQGRERQLADLALFGWGARTWSVPIWTEVQILASAYAAGSDRIACDTEGLDFRVGGQAMLIGDSALEYEVVGVAAIDAAGIDLQLATQQAWPAGTRLYPARAGRLLEQPTRTRKTDRAQTMVARFELAEVSDWTATPPAALYRGRPVWEFRPEESEDLTAITDRILELLDNGSALPALTDTSGAAFPVQQLRWLGLGRAERATWRSLLYALNGRQAAVWLPTYADDLTIIESIDAAGTAIDIDWIGYTRFAGAAPARRDIRIELRSGTVIYRRITGATEIDATRERLTIDAALGVAVAAGDIAMVSWMTLARLDNDEVEIDHVTDSMGVAAAMLTFRTVRDDEL